MYIKYSTYAQSFIYVCVCPLSVGVIIAAMQHSSKVSLSDMTKGAIERRLDNTCSSSHGLWQLGGCCVELLLVSQNYSNWNEM